MKGFIAFSTSFLLITISSCGVDTPTKPTPKQVAVSNPVAKKVEPIDYTKGEKVFEDLKYRVCEERGKQLCWKSQGYALNGDRILKKEFTTTWGGDRVLIIPNDEWIGLSSNDKKDLGDYLRHTGVGKIITGRVIPSRYSDDSINPDRDVMTVDTTVWTSDK